MLSDNFNRAYKDRDVPWSFREPPAELVELISSGKVKPCKTLEVGCGEGWYSIFLANAGFDITGIDFSEEAIDAAKINAEKASANCNFLVMNWKELPEMNHKFDFILDWRFLHEILNEEERKEYVKIIASLLKSDGKYLSVSFSEKSSLWGTGKVRHIRIPKGTMLYFASMEELEDLFGKYFKILGVKEIELLSKGAGYCTSNYFFVERKN